LARARPADFVPHTATQGELYDSAAHAKLTIDGTDASLRAAVGTLLGDERLHADAQRRREAVNARRAAIRLRGAAHERTREAESWTRARREQAERVANVERLEATEAKSAALAEQADAIRAKDEADRLARSASTVKDERKRG
jgi:hypothetical protein